MTKVSVVVPAYNVADFLERCVESLLAQTESSIQVVIVDDGATDGTPQLADNLALSDSRVLVIHQGNQGLSAARNAGLNAAVGEFVCFVDGDDWVEPRMIERMLYWIESAKAQVAIAGYVVDYHDSNESIRKSMIVRPNYGIIRGSVDSPEMATNREFIGLLGYAWNKLFRREWLQSLEEYFEPNLRLIEDIEFNSRVLSSANNVVLCPEAFIHYIQRPGASLGKARDDSFLELRLRALRCVDELLENWGVDSEDRVKVRANTSVYDLWSALNSAAATATPLQSIEGMLARPGVTQLIEATQGTRPDTWKARWVAATIKPRRLRVALIPFMVYHVLKRFS